MTTRSSLRFALWIGGLSALAAPLAVRSAEPIDAPREMLEGDILHIAQAWKDRVFLIVADGGPERVAIEEVCQNPKVLYRKRLVGSAVYVGDRRLLLTTAAIVHGNTEVEVFNDKGEHVLAQIIGVDPHLDLALIEAVEDLPGIGDAPPLEAVDDVSAGAACMVLGNAYGRELSASLGTVGDMVDIFPGSSPLMLREVNAPIYPGDSGGAVLDAQGRFLGVVTAAVHAMDRATRKEYVGEIEIRELGATPAGESGFAVPGRECRRAWIDLREHGRVRRGFLGVHTLSPGGGSGVQILQVQPGSPADVIGILPGDVIVTFGNRPVTSSRQLCAMVSGTHPNERVNLLVVRGRYELTLSVRLSEASRPPGVSRLRPAPVVEQPVGARLSEGP
jgi:S1-C subfamily serine protease